MRRFGPGLRAEPLRQSVLAPPPQLSQHRQPAPVHTVLPPLRRLCLLRPRRRGRDRRRRGHRRLLGCLCLLLGPPGRPLGLPLLLAGLPLLLLALLPRALRLLLPPPPVLLALLAGLGLLLAL